VFAQWTLKQVLAETTTGRPLTDAEVAERCREHEKMLADIAAERQQDQLNAAADEQRRWDRAIPAPVDHPYLVKKQIPACGARLEGSALLIPMFDIEGMVQSVQEISPNGRKHNEKGGRRKGCFFPIGEPGDMFLIGEGFSTCATLHAATGLGVISAGDAGNLGIVAQNMRDLHPDATIVVCADDDWKTATGNTGKIAAEKTAKEINGILCLPRFRADRPDALARGERAPKPGTFTWDARQS
jgi:putative DNA primase/helicase